MKRNKLKDQSGQTLIEYLIIIALVGVGSIALMRAVSQNINARFATVVKALGGSVEGSRAADKVTEDMYKKRDLRNFVNGAVSTKTGSQSGAGHDAETSDD